MKQIYNCLKALYNHPLSSVKLNNYVIDWFSTCTESGVRQYVSLSTTFFAIFINDLTKELDMGIPFNNDKICILCFADDIVTLAKNEFQLQKILGPCKYMV